MDSIAQQYEATEWVNPTSHGITFTVLVGPLAAGVLVVLVLVNLLGIIPLIPMVVLCYLILVLIIYGSVTARSWTQWQVAVKDGFLLVKDDQEGITEHRIGEVFVSSDRILANNIVIATKYGDLGYSEEFVAKIWPFLMGGKFVNDIEMSWLIWRRAAARERIMLLLSVGVILVGAAVLLLSP